LVTSHSRVSSDTLSWSGVPGHGMRRKSVVGFALGLTGVHVV
jgi:hypothetical protein